MDTTPVLFNRGLRTPKRPPGCERAIWRSRQLDVGWRLASFVPSRSGCDLGSDCVEPPSPEAGFAQAAAPTLIHLFVTRALCHPSLPAPPVSGVLSLFLHLSSVLPCLLCLQAVASGKPHPTIFTSCVVTFLPALSLVSCASAFLVTSPLSLPLPTEPSPFFFLLPWTPFFRLLPALRPALRSKFNRSRQTLKPQLEMMSIRTAVILPPLTQAFCVKWGASFDSFTVGNERITCHICQSRGRRPKRTFGKKRHFLLWWLHIVELLYFKFDTTH